MRRETEAAMEHLRAAIVRAVRQICPAWLSAHRDDIAQEACLRIARKLENAEEPVDLGSSYLWRAAHSAVMDEIRRRRRHPETPLEDADDETPSDRPTPERHRASVELQEAIDVALEALPAPRRAAVVLYLHGYSLRESAEVLGWTVKRVDNQRYQGLAALRAHLKKRGFTP